jgi:uncharacterized membrane protein
MMIEWILIVARELGLAVWLGGLVVIDFVEAPAKFRTPEISRNQAIAVGRQVFAAVNRMEVALGALLLAVTAGILVRTNLASQVEGTSVACIGVMWAVALAQNFWLRPRMSTPGLSFDPVNRQVEEPRYGKLKCMHRTYIAFDLLKLVLGLVTFAMWTRVRSI